MRVSKGVEWALHTALLLAQAPEGSWTARRTIAEFYDLPEPYLAKYLQRLVAAGVLVATTGPRGGYRLAAPPGEITALAVFEAIEGSAPVFTCQDIRRQGRRPMRSANVSALSTPLLTPPTLRGGLSWRARLWLILWASFRIRSRTALPTSFLKRHLGRVWPLSAVARAGRDSDG